MMVFISRTSIQGLFSPNSIWRGTYNFPCPGSMRRTHRRGRVHRQRTLRRGSCLPVPRRFVVSPCGILGVGCSKRRVRRTYLAHKPTRRPGIDRRLSSTSRPIQPARILPGCRSSMRPTLMRMWCGRNHFPDRSNGLRRPCTHS